VRIAAEADNALQRTFEGTSTVGPPIGGDHRSTGCGGSGFYVQIRGRRTYQILEGKRKKSGSLELFIVANLMRAKLRWWTPSGMAKSRLAAAFITTI
jgi:hypothetical protein